MMLSNKELNDLISSGSLKITPSIDKSSIGVSSIDLHLGEVITEMKEFDGITIRPGKSYPNGLFLTGNVNKSLIIKPNELKLALTKEHITMPLEYAGFVEGRSTYARFGISIHVTAPLIEPGFVGNITLEITNNGPNKVELVPNEDAVCQLILFTLSSPVSKDLSKLVNYKDQKSGAPRTY
jgi:dCTP deaminase